MSIRTMQDREASESVPSTSRLSIRSTYELIRVAAMQDPERTAITLPEDLKRSDMSHPEISPEGLR